MEYAVEIDSEGGWPLNSTPGSWDRRTCRLSKHSSSKTLLMERSQFPLSQHHSVTNGGWWLSPTNTRLARQH